MSYLLKIIAAMGLILLIPIIILALILVFIEDGYPMIFSQSRLGKDKILFNIYKIRTMKKNTPNKGTHHISKDHYLFFGAFFRKTKIDELPQIINYLSGHINLVGPRPGLENQKQLTYAREKNNIFNIKPGITGISQVLGYDMSNPKKLAEIDKIYLNKKSLKLNLIIFISTFLKPLRVKLYENLKSEINYVEEKYKNV